MGQGRPGLPSASRPNVLFPPAVGVINVHHVLPLFQVPFPVLQGEGVEYLGHADEAIIAISNYRLHIKFKDSVINVSVMAITGKRRAEALESKPPLLSSGRRSCSM